MNSMQDVIKYLVSYNGDVTTTELTPAYDSRKSFYGKAKVKHINNLHLLYSYNALVCAVYGCAKCDKYFLNNDVAERLLFSNTTLRHIKEFLKQYTTIKTDITKQDIIRNEGKEIF
jgi:hypothetical protein